MMVRQGNVFKPSVKLPIGGVISLVCKLPRRLNLWGFYFYGVMMQKVMDIRPRANAGKQKVTAEPLFNWQRHLNVLLVPVVLLVFGLLWQTLVWVGEYPPFILPTPANVLTAFAGALTDGTLRRHAQQTLTEVFVGLAVGVSAATILGYVLAKNKMLEQLLSPYIVASQSVPVVAIAPLLIIWFGAGQLSKILICTLMVFFPMLINTIVGIRSVEPDLRELFRSLQADRWDTFRLLEVPAASPVLLGGLKMSVTMAVIGAVVGEFVGADYGLGFLINQARGLFNTSLVFVAIMALVAIALALYGVVALLEAHLLRWRG